ncbi:hypothetical protein [Saccharopolyspora pogona]|nr:hypothetical protein [Saccharopolyspora pogona]
MRCSVIVHDADGLADYLLDQHGIGVLSGAAFDAIRPDCGSAPQPAYST